MPRVVFKTTVTFDSIPLLEIYNCMHAHVRTKTAMRGVAHADTPHEGTSSPYLCTCERKKIRDINIHAYDMNKCTGITNFDYNVPT